MNLFNLYTTIKILHRVGSFGMFTLKVEIFTSSTNHFYSNIHCDRKTATTWKLNFSQIFRKITTFLPAMCFYRNTNTLVSVVSFLVTSLLGVANTIPYFILNAVFNFCFSLLIHWPYFWMWKNSILIIFLFSNFYFFCVCIILFSLILFVRIKLLYLFIWLFVCDFFLFRLPFNQTWNDV